MGVEADRFALEGIDFYVRPQSRQPSEYPFPSAKRDERLEAVETLYFLTLILSTAYDTPPICDTPEGAVKFIPYYEVPQSLTAPRRNNAASLAVVARFFRLDRRRDLRGRVFNFDISVEGWATPDTVLPADMESEEPSTSTLESDESQVAAFERDEKGYRRIAQVSGNKSSMHGAVSYFVLKLLAVMKEFRQVSHRHHHFTIFRPTSHKSNYINHSGEVAKTLISMRALQLFRHRCIPPSH
jgi:hypothetical protein